jgi:hypothetical protein
MKSKTKKYHTVEIVPKSEKIVERGKIDILTHKPDGALSWLGTGTSIKRDGVKLVLLPQTGSLIVYYGLLIHITWE